MEVGRNKERERDLKSLSLSSQRFSLSHQFFPNNSIYRMKSAKEVGRVLQAAELAPEIGDDEIGGLEESDRLQSPIS